MTCYPPEWGKNLLIYDGRGLPDPDWDNWSRRMVLKLQSLNSLILLDQKQVTVTLCPSSDIGQKLGCIEEVLSSSP